MYAFEVGSAIEAADDAEMILASIEARWPGPR
jgi:hypothetical protein